MFNLKNDKKQFKHRVEYFYDCYLGAVPTKENIDLLYNYVTYCIDANFGYGINQDIMDKGLEIYRETNKEVDDPSFIEGMNFAKKQCNFVISQKDMEINDLKSKLRTANSKLGNLKSDLMNQIHKLEASLKEKQPILSKMHAAYLAAQTNRELIIKNPAPNTIVRVKNTKNFRTWLNQVWKYGKADKQLNGNYKKISGDVGFGYIDEQPVRVVMPRTTRRQAATTLQPPTPRPTYN